MEKHLAEAVRNIIESLITLKKDYTDDSRSYPTYKIEPDPIWTKEVIIKIHCELTCDTLQIAHFIMCYGAFHVEITDNHNLIIS